MAFDVIYVRSPLGCILRTLSAISDRTRLLCHPDLMRCLVNGNGIVCRHQSPGVLYQLFDVSSSGISRFRLHPGCISKPNVQLGSHDVGHVDAKRCNYNILILVVAANVISLEETRALLPRCFALLIQIRQSRIERLDPHDFCLPLLPVCIAFNRGY